MINTAEEYRQQFRGRGVHISSIDIREAFEEGAEWMEKQMIEKAYNWLDEHWSDYFGEDEDFNGWHMMRDFRKAMEELRDK